MTVKIRSGKLRLAFWLPLSMIKGRLAQRMLAESVARSKSVGRSHRGEQKGVAAQDVCERCVAEHDGSATAAADIPVADEVAGVVSEDLSASNSRLPQIAQNAAPSERDGGGATPPVVTRAKLRELYAVLKKFVRMNGHFVLLDVESPENNTRVRFKV